MKRTLLICLFIALVLGLFAQKGMFDISFGQDISDVNKALLAKGFTVSEKTDTSTLYKSTKIPRLASLSVRDLDKNGTVSGWTIRFTVNGDQTIIDKYMADLTALHKVESYYDDYYEEDVWELENEKAIYVYPTGDESETLIIEYTDFDDYWDYWY
ncbi:MAG: hypothetical protein CVU50_01305 [Candidatus Cloacimonetes bacterium HGW-Cloacimonetes-3]|jgi:hypothetical protein|nr:MAG: hypothetical protein CVU50_01305 [Candidatus Cloacimonetes bacterium HGW-Cloacimonetes-3]